MTRSRNFLGDIVQATFLSADTEVEVTHALGMVPRGAFVLGKTTAGQIYYTSTSDGVNGNLSSNNVAAWEFEDNTNLGNDSGSSNLDLTNSNATQVAGVVGYASDYVTASSQYMYRASEAALQMGDITFSYCAWVKLNAKTASQMLVTKAGVGASLSDYDLFFDVGRDRFSSRVWRSTGQVLVDANGLGSPTQGTWYFIVVEHNATADTLSIQVNNGTITSVATGGALQAVSASQFQIGARENSVSRLFATASIDQVMMWKRALTTDERTYLYNGGNGRTAANALAAFNFVPKDWTTTTAYLKCSSAGTIANLLFFV